MLRGGPGLESAKGRTRARSVSAIAARAQSSSPPKPPLPFFFGLPRAGLPSRPSRVCR